MSLESCVDHSDDRGDYVVTFDNNPRYTGRRTCPVCALIAEMEALKEKLGDTEVALDTVNKDNEELRTKLEEMKNEA